MCLQVKKATNADWLKYTQAITDVDLDIREKWLGIKFLKKSHRPKLFEKKDRFGRALNFEEHAEAAADI